MTMPCPDALAFVQSDLASIVAGLPFRDGDGRIDIVDPATGVAVGSFVAGTIATVDAAVAAARAALDGPWGRMRPADRERLILKLADLIEADASVLADLETLDNGMVRGFAQAVSVGAGVEYLRYMAGWATKLEGATLDLSLPHPPGTDVWGYTIRQPVGVVGAITPWNVPLLMAVWKLGPALAAGCTLVLKPAEDTSVSALRLAGLVQQAGIPDGVVNVVLGRGAEVGAALINHPGIDKLAFTGSTAVGRQIGLAAMERFLPVSLELGGKSPVIILGDADIDAAAAAAAGAIFINSGQICTAGSRLLIHRSRYEAVVERLGAIAGNLKLGSGFAGDTHLGPLVNARQQARVSGFIAQAQADGARVLTAAQTGPAGGYFVAPAVVADVAPTSRIVQEEVFGPVVAALPFDTVEEAAALANDSVYGLGASIWSNDLKAVNTLTRAVRSGVVWVNTHNFIDPNLPFGGMKQSGVGREMGRVVVESYTSLKSVCMVS